MKMNIHEQWKWTVNQIGNEGVQSLSESLKINTTLTQLYLYSDEEMLNFEDEDEEKWTMNNEQITK